MLKLNRTTEYGLIAITYIRNKKQGELTSAREIAAHFSLPFEILAKTLQRLKEQGVIASTYGTRGGYVLARDLASLNLAEFLKMMEGQVGVVACASAHETHSDCGYSDQCNIKKMMSALNNRFYDFMSRISIEEITRSPIELSSISTTLLSSDRTAVAFQGGEP